MILNLITLYLMLSVACIMYLTAFIFGNGKATYMKILGTECTLISIYVFGYMMELHAKNLQDAIFWNGVQYLAIPFISTMWLLMSAMYIGSIKKLRDWRVYLIFLVPIGTFLIRFTNHWHHWYYTGYTMNVIGQLQFMVLEKGPWYWVQSLHIVVTSALSVYVFFHAYKNRKAHDRMKYTLLLIASLIPIVCVVLIFTTAKSIGFDPMDFCLPIAEALMTYAVVHYDFLEIKTLARDELFESSMDSMLVMNTAMKIIDFNQNASDFLKMHGINLVESRLEDHQNKAPELISALRETSEVVYETKKDGHTAYWKIETKNIFNTRKEIYGQLKTIRNVTTTIETERYLEKIAATDELSQLNNRHKFIESGHKMVAAALTENAEMTMMLDIDHFKNVNDTFGHQIGDEVIKGISRSLSTKFQNSGMVSRIGGEEFTVIMYGWGLDAAYSQAEEFRKEVQASRFVEDSDYQITISIGVAAWGEGGYLDHLAQTCRCCTIPSKKCWQKPSLFV